MVGYRDDEFCIFCEKDLIYMSQYGWLCPNHSPTVLYNFSRATISYSKHTRIIKDGVGVIVSTNSFEKEFSKTMFVEFNKLDPNSYSLKLASSYLTNFTKDLYINKLIWRNRSYISNHYTIITTLENNSINVDPDDFDKVLDRINKLMPFS